MLRTFRYRLYPNRAQRDRIWKNMNACRFIYNWALETKKMAYEQDGTNLSWYDLNNRLKELKVQHPWLKDAYSQSLQQAIKRLHQAFQHFFRRSTQAREKPGYPKFRSRKHHRQSFSVPQFFFIDFKSRRVRLPKIGGIRTVFHRKFKGTPKTITVVSTLTGKFFISIVVEDGNTFPVKKRATRKTSVGIDVGLKTYVTISTGVKIENPQFLISSLKRVRCLHRRLSKKEKGSRNRAKARQRLARCHERIVNQRTDFHQKLSTQLIRENQAIIVESLNVSGMVKNRRLAKRISDAAWSSFLYMLKYKAAWYGVTILQIGRFEPTSKLCHVCGHKNIGLALSDREWTCPVCSIHHDRDINAAQNIKMIGLRSIITPREPREGPVELSALAEASKQETPTFWEG